MRINVCAVYLLTLADFFAKPYHQLQDMFAEHHQPTGEQSVSVLDKTDGSVQPSGTFPMTISAKLKQCEVVLFAEPTKTNSRVLVVKVGRFAPSFK